MLAFKIAWKVQRAITIIINQIEIVLELSNKDINIIRFNNKNNRISNGLKIITINKIINYIV